ncbi:Protein still life, isoforms C/SIF type 2 [Exaiptasia diaphana]|nr:Protein still life, isoforms C/SIF type 2 [Exaiptasia diaphana]
MNFLTIYFFFVEEEVKARSKAKRSPSNIGYNKIKSAIFTSLRINDASSVKSIRDRYANKNGPKTPKTFKRSNLEIIPDSEEEQSEARSLSSSHSEWRSLGNYLRISLPSNQSTVIALGNEMTVQDVVVNTCEKRQLDPHTYFLKLGLQEEDGTIDYFIPKQDSLLEDQNYTHLKLCQKCIYKVELTKSLEVDGLDFGLSVASKDGMIYISRVEKGRLAHVQGVLAGDEILAVNDVPVGDVETNPLGDLQEALQDSCIKLELQSPRDEPPVAHKVTSDAIISSLVIKPPPKLSDNIEDTELVDMIVPPPAMLDDGETCSSIHTPEAPETPPTEHKTVDELLQQAEQVTIFCRQQLEYSDDESRPNIHLTEADKLRKVIIELLDTERSYVKDLKLLLNRYLDPLKDESFMSQSEVKALVGTVDEILDFQKTFFQELKKAIESEAGFEEFDEISKFQNVIYTIGETFLNYTEHFKLYSAFCSSHSRLVELLSTGQNEDLRNFLNARNPKNQHSGTLESYLIKPIQRILRYPLLMRTILKALDKKSEEHEVLLEAVVAVEKVATHINEMQRITERFAPLFNQIVGEYGMVEVSDVTIDRLLHHGKATWLNCPDEPRSGTLKLKYPASPRIHKKTTHSTMHIFVFEKVVILIHLESKSRKKEKSSSLKTSEEIKFKTLIPVTSLVLRDHRWATGETLHSWELVNISDTTELGRQECAYLFASKTAAEQREAVKSIKEAIKRSIKAGSNVTTIRSHSFRRADNVSTTPAPANNLNSTFPMTGNSNFLRSQPDGGLLRRSFSHNPEEALTRRSSLLEDQHTQFLQAFQDDSQNSDNESCLSDRVSVVIKDEQAKPVDMGTY